jgi:two-component SAPR family response regulator
MNVLLIDDEENIQSIISAFLSRYAEIHKDQLEVKQLFDPVQGLFEITSNGNHYDLILLDVRLPKLTGDEIYQSIMHVNPELLDKVLFITGYREDLDARFPGKNLRVLDKPFRYAQLEMQIDDILKR